MPSTLLPIKGLAYYQAESLWANGLLIEGETLKLVAEPNNPFDCFAVQVWCQKQMIGYLPRQSAPWFHYLLNHHAELQARLGNISKSHYPLKGQVQLKFQANWWHRWHFPIWRLIHLWQHATIAGSNTTNE